MTIVSSCGATAMPRSPSTIMSNFRFWPIFRTDGGVWILTNHMVMMFIAAGLMLLIFPAITRRYRDGEADVDTLLGEQPTSRA